MRFDRARACVRFTIDYCMFTRDPSETDPQEGLAGRRTRASSRVFLLSFKFLFLSSFSPLNSSSDHAARKPRSRISCGLGSLALRADFGRVTLAEIIFELVDDDGAADDGVRAVERNLRIRNGKVATRRGGLDVAEITGVTNGISRRAVVHAVRVEVRARGHASVRRVAELVNVKPVLPRGQAGDGTDDGGGAVALLGKLDDAGDTGGTGEDDDGLLLGGDDGENTRARRRGSDRGATKGGGQSGGSIDRSTREPRDATTEASRRASEKRNHRASDSTLARLAGASDRPRVDGEKGSIDRSQSHHQPTIIHPSVETSDERRSPRTYRLHAHAAPQKCFLDASVAVEVLARADMFESDDGRGGVRSEET